VTLYALLLLAHSYVRWGVLAIAALLLARSARGWRDARAWSGADERTHVALVALVDTQLLLGLWLYLSASPIARAFLADPGRATKITALRFFGLEHAVIMLAAVIVIHVGRARSKVKDRHRRAATSTALALALILAGVPWPFLRHGRPLLRGPTASAGAAAACPPSYAERCAACHGERGRGDGIASSSLTPRPRDFSDARWWGARSDAEIAAIIRDGGARHGLSAAMPAQADLAGPDVDALVGCLRSFQGIAP
jgi:mono/diheme cytochrome c family protein